MTKQAGRKLAGALAFTLRIALASVFLVSLSAVPGVVQLGPTYALADDDGDDGGDDGGGASGNAGGGFGSRNESSRERKKQLKPILKRQTQKKVQKKKSVRAQQRLVIVALDVPDSALPALGREGFVVLSDDRLATTGIRIQRLRAPANYSATRARAAVIRLGAAAADLNTLYAPQSQEDCNDGAGCGMRHIVGWPDAANRACAGEPRIGLVETHLELQHPALAGQKIEVIDVKPKDRPNSSTGHGTGVVSLLIGAKGSMAEGLLPGAELVVATPFYRVGKTDRAEAADLIRAIDAVVARQPDVLNLSLAGPRNDVLEKVLVTVREKGIPVVAAAGNGGAASEPLYPAAYATTFSVTAVTSGLSIFRRASRGAHVDIAAPGVEVVVANGKSGTARRSGTSFAAPFVAASFAVMRKAKPLEPIDAFAGEIAARARDLGAPGKDPVFGWGLLDASGICGAGLDARLQWASQPMEKAGQTISP